MTTQVKPWGNSQGIRLTKELLDRAGIKVDDTLHIQVEDGKIILSVNFRHRTLEERAKKYGGKVGTYEEFDWGDPVGREVW